MAWKKKFTPEEKAAYHKQKQEEMKQMFQQIDDGVKAVFQSDRYKDYLKFMSKFTDYSARNTILINLQKPDATLIASYGKWKQLGRTVDKGQSGIAILAPVPFKTDQTEQIERPVVDEWGNRQYNADGTEKTEILEKPVMNIAFRKVYVFDVSQTSGKDLPEPVQELQGDIDPDRKEAVFKALRKATGIKIEFADIPDDVKGYYHAGKQQIVINKGMSDAQTLKTAFHESAHSILHNPENQMATYKSSRSEKEVQAESTAFIVATKFGLDTSEYSFPYIASWSDGKQLEQLTKVLDEIQETAGKLSSAIDSELLKLQKRDLTMDEKLADTELNNIQKAEILIEDCAERKIVFSEEDTKKILEFAENHEEISETVKMIQDMEEIQKQLDNYGYDFSAVNVLLKQNALRAFDDGEPVYLLYPDDTESLAENRSEIEQFSGFFGIMKEPVENKLQNLDADLIAVSKKEALEMWDNSMDVYVGGIPAQNRDYIENAPDNSSFHVSQYQYSAQMDFDNPQRGRNMPQNPNIFGNTPYRELGDKSQLQYYSKLKPRHAENIARQLESDGVRFSGRKNGYEVTITINKADIPRYEAAVAKVKADYQNQQTSQRSNQEYRNESQAGRNPNIFGNTSYSALGNRQDLQYITKLNPRYAEQIARQLNADGVRFSGLHKGNTDTITINKADIPKYEEAAAKVRADYSQNHDSREEQAYSQRNYDAPARGNASANSNIIGNTPYSELGNKADLQYYTNLKNHHAEKIAEQLQADGVRFSGLKRDTVTTITINKADIPRYETAVDKVRAGYEKNQEQSFSFPDERKEIPEQNRSNPPSWKNLPICTMSFLEAKQNNCVDTLRDSILASKACRDFINQHLSEQYENRNLKGFVQELEEKFGMERTMYTLAATIQRKNEDGRFTSKVRERAGLFNFDSSEMLLRFLTEKHPVMVNYLYEMLMDREKELKLTAQKQAVYKLPGHLADKFLLSQERVELKDDFRGIPETNYYKSSANEWFVDEIGWLDDAAYERELKLSQLRAEEFYKKVKSVNASCIDAEGTVSNIDMSAEDYRTLTEKTYAPENKQALEMAKAKLEERKENADISEKPTEYYAVRQMSDKKFSVCTLSADGLVTAVYPNILTVAEAKKTMLELFHKRKETAHVELIHPQTLDEKSAELYRTQPKELPDTVYRIQLNEKKNAPDTHYLQKYLKKPDDTYKVDEVVCRGDFYQCNTALTELLKNKSITEEKLTDALPPKPVQNDYSIYQLKWIPETRNIRFESYDTLMKENHKPDIANYDLAYQGNIADITKSSDTTVQLETLFNKFNVDRPEDFKGRSLSVSDVVVLYDKAYYVDRIGFKSLPEFLKPELKAEEKEKPKKPKL